MLPVKHIYIAVAIIVVAIIVGLGVHAYISDLLARQHYNDVKKALQQTLDDQLASIRKDHDAAKTPTQIATMVPKYFPNVHPVVFAGKPDTQASKIAGFLPETADSALPDDPGALLIPSTDVPAFWNNVTKCAENTASLGTCQKQLAAAEETIKGGKWYVRVWRQTKPIICSSLGGGIAAAAGAKPPIIAGAAAGAGTFCAIAGK